MYLVNKKRRQQGLFSGILQVIVILENLVSLAICETKIRITPDGGYTNIVVKIDENVNEMFCSQYIKHMRVSKKWRERKKRP